MDIEGLHPLIAGVGDEEDLIGADEHAARAVEQVIGGSGATTAADSADPVAVAAVVDLDAVVAGIADVDGAVRGDGDPRGRAEAPGSPPATSG